MPVRRLLATVLVAAATVPVGATPAAAHGAPTDPISRAAACGPEGRYAATSACRAAIQAGAAVREWDNVRVSTINGRDRERIPDGELCSGGLSAYRGLDLPRTDWPSTTLTAGAKFTFRYRTTIEHRGTFRLYVTTPDYDPRKKLTWGDLESRPFLTLTDPPVRAGAYQLAGRLPAGRSGRHLIYTIWQNSNTPDTYYSCSDVVFRGAKAAGATATATPAKAGATKSAPAAPRTAASGPVATEPAVAAAADPGVPVASVTNLGGRWPVLAGAAAVLVLALLLIGAGRRRRSAAAPVGRQCEVRNHRAGRRRIW
ncbi:lytic polysaccharide monooxygenase [Micromonospora noduli]|uniref:Chitin-binding protein CbpD n=1 Tax=Micromonospora noduli TaxID=709876 RepID=A0A328NAF2_9ACTN|nr:lytic polysaccharide monooxygenase [Micromonospora noduli]KAB1919976.1 lytic polysaccharide monooxygenase [Micromonospora noduli]RAO06180.1 Chitin-binding protein CbpD [Micromonospora noduli]RAO35488.1 Chitin-binding protein CbpD [Micromonospora noduli]RAO53177.1 Chitin-binding protein CbpD [Micromonospora noduli]